MIMRKLACAATLAVVAVSSVPAFAEPTTGPVRITQVRPYNSAGAPDGAVFVAVVSADPAVPVACTTVFQIDLTYGGGKAVYAAALTALATGKTVQIEMVNDGGCAGWGTKIQSLYVNDGP